MPTLSVSENITLPVRLDGRQVDHKRVRGRGRGTFGGCRQSRGEPGRITGGALHVTGGL